MLMKFSFQKIGLNNIISKNCKYKNTKYNKYSSFSPINFIMHFSMKNPALKIVNNL